MTVPGDVPASSRFEAALAWLPPPLADRARLYVAREDAAHRGRALVWATAVAGMAGCRVEGQLLGDAPADDGEATNATDVPDVLRLTCPGDRTVAMTVVAAKGAPTAAGDPADVERLVDAIGASLGAWKFAVHLRRPVPRGFDPSSVAYAVGLWRRAMDQGEWRGRHAVYEDEAVAVDLSVTERRPSPEDPGGRIVFVPPIDAPDRLMGLYATILRAAQRVDEADPDIPLIVALYTEPAWRLPRGYVLDLLYGMPDRIVTESGGERPYEATHRPTGVHLFSDPSCRNLGSLWWLESGGEGALRGRAHDNPWCVEARHVPAFPGVRYACVDPDGPPGESRRPVVMALTGSGLTSWEATR